MRLEVFLSFGAFFEQTNEHELGVKFLKYALSSVWRRIKQMKEVTINADDASGEEQVCKLRMLL
jgi:hypothetical protein